MRKPKTLLHVLHGGYWNNTTVDEAHPFKKLFLDELINEMRKREEALTLPSKAKMLADADRQEWQLGGSTSHRTTESESGNGDGFACQQKP